jgi:hypothetical protein
MVSADVSDFESTDPFALLLQAVKRETLAANISKKIFFILPGLG